MVKELKKLSILTCLAIVFAAASASQCLAIPIVKGHQLRADEIRKGGYAHKATSPPSMAGQPTTSYGLRAACGSKTAYGVKAAEPSRTPTSSSRGK